jgi:hypothetical protein
MLWGNGCKWMAVVRRGCKGQKDPYRSEDLDCLISFPVIEEQETNLMSLVIMFYFTSMLNMFRTLIHPSSGACDLSIVSPQWSCVLVSMCVGVSVWLGWGGTV